MLQTSTPIGSDNATVSNALLDFDDDDIAEISVL